jgi:hypothetical protein
MNYGVVENSTIDGDILNVGRGFRARRKERTSMVRKHDEEGEF